MRNILLAATAAIILTATSAWAERACRWWGTWTTFNASDCAISGTNHGTSSKSGTPKKQLAKAKKSKESQ